MDIEKGQIFGRYIYTGESILELNSTGNRKERKLICKCECGNIRKVTRHLLKSGKSQSCGCLRNETKRRHGLRHHHLYGVWLNIKNRCYNPNHKFYSYYGGRGIIMCEEWKNNFLPFYEWAQSTGYQTKPHPHKMTIDRIDNNSNYSPENCSWASMKEQSRNRRNNALFLYEGKLLAISTIAEKIGINRTSVEVKLKKGMSVEDIVKTHVKLK